MKVNVYGVENQNGLRSFCMCLHVKHKSIAEFRKLRHKGGKITHTTQKLVFVLSVSCREPITFNVVCENYFGSADCVEVIR